MCVNRFAGFYVFGIGEVVEEVDYRPPGKCIIHYLEFEIKLRR